MFTRAIVRPPAPNFSAGLTTAGLGAPVYELALKQHDAYCAALEQCGLKLTSLEPDRNYPDSTFVEDVAVLFEAIPDGRANAPMSTSDCCALLTRPGALSRAGEVVSMRALLADYFPSLSAIEPPGTLDGGDICEAGDHFFIGISERTNEAGAKQLADLVAAFGYTSSVVDIRGTGDPPVNHPQDARATSNILHLKSGISYLGDRRLVVTQGLAGRAEFAGYDLIQVNSGEEYATNCVRVNDHVLVATGYPAFEKHLRDFGYQTITLDMSEFQKMDGGLSCLSLRF